MKKGGKGGIPDGGMLMVKDIGIVEGKERNC